MGILFSGPKACSTLVDGPQLTLDVISSYPKLEPHEIAALQLASHGTYAALSAHVYSAGAPDVSTAVPLPDGWDVFLQCSSLRLHREGYYAVAYLHRSSRHCIIAQRGTSEVLGLRAGVWMYFDQPTIQFSLAAQFSQAVRQALDKLDNGPSNWFVSYTGHSLGAVLAACRAIEEQTYAVTFESPGARAYIEKNVDTYTSMDDHVVTYLRAPNPINTLKPHCGFLILIPTQSVVLPSGTLFLAPSSDSTSSAVETANNKRRSGGGTSSSNSADAAAASPSAVGSNNGNGIGGSNGSGGANPNAGVRWRMPSFRPQEYLRGYVFSSVGMGIPELQQYVSKVEPMIREMLEQTQQVHSIHRMREHFQKQEEPGNEEEVVRWPSHLLQFMEYYNTTRALEDPENQELPIKQAYTDLLHRLCRTTPRRRDCISLRYIDPTSESVVRMWWRAEPAQRKTWPISMIDHKTLNVIQLKDGYLCCSVITALQAKQYLIRLCARDDICAMIDQWKAKAAPGNVPSISKL